MSNKAFCDACGAEVGHRWHWICYGLGGKIVDICQECWEKNVSPFLLPPYKKEEDE